MVEDPFYFDIRRYWHLFKKHVWVIVLAAAFAGAAAYVTSRFFTTPIYQATVDILVQPSSSLSSTEYVDIMAGQRVTATYAEVLESRPVREAAFARLGYTPEDVEELDQQGVFFSVSVIPVRDTQLINVSVESTHPELVVEYANALAATFRDLNQQRQRERFEEAQEELRAQVTALESELAQLTERLAEAEDAGERQRLKVQIIQREDSLTRYNTTYQNINLVKAQVVDLIDIVQPAILPATLLRPRTMTSTLLATVVGAVLALGGIFLREWLDTSVKSPDEARVITQAPLLGQIWYEKAIVDANGTGPKIVTQSPLSLTAEAFRLLRANLEFTSVDKSNRALLVTSPSPTEGKSTITLNLALALALANKRVILIDADMRRPRLHHYASIAREPGLSDALLDPQLDVDHYLSPLSEVENVALLPAGKVPPNPAELLGSQRMAQLLDACLAHADVVLVDSPPLLAAADAAVLASQTDGVLLVMEPGSTDRKALEQAVQQLQRSGARLLGNVFNKVRTDNKGGYYYYYYYSHEEAPSRWQKLLPEFLREGRKSQQQAPSGR